MIVRKWNQRWKMAGWSRMVLALLVLSLSLAPGVEQRSRAAEQAWSPAAMHGGPPVLRFEQVSLRQGLSQSSVYATWQDHLGFLWFGTEGGLNKFDGYEFTIYKHDPDNPSTLANNIVWTIYEDQAGGLWIGTGNGLDRIDRRMGTFEHFKPNPDDPDSLSSGVVWAILEDRAGNLWVGTDGGGLNVLDRTTGKFSHYRHDPADSNTIASDSIKSILEDQAGNLWIGTGNGLDHLDRTTGTFTHHRPVPLNEQNSASNLILSIYEAADGSLWAGSNGNGLGRFDPASQTWTSFTNDPDNLYSISNDVVWDFLEDRQGQLWVGTDDGLDLFDPSRGLFYHYRHDPNRLDSLSRDSIRSLFEDRSGVFWVGTYGGGLSKSNHIIEKFNLYREEPGLANSLTDNYIWSVWEDRSGVLWLGTFKGGLNRLDRSAGQVTAYQNDPKNPASLSSDDVRAVLEDRDGFIWAGTGSHGLNRFDPQNGIFTRFQHDPKDPASLGFDQIRVLFEDREGFLWVGGFSGGLDRFDPKTGDFRHYRHDPNDAGSLVSDRVRALYQDLSDQLWIGTSAGISVLDPSSGEMVSYLAEPENSQALSHPTIFGFYESLGGDMWIATFGGGLNRFNRAARTFTHYTEAQGLPHNQVYAILPDAQGRLWLSTNNGLSRFDPASQTFRNYGLQDGLQSVEFNLGAAFRSSTGELFFGGVEGLNTFFPDQVKDNPFVPPLVITRFQKYNQTILVDLDPSEPLQLSYRDNFFSFEFASLDFAAPEKNQYAYMLEGFDKDWIYAGPRRYASYTNLDGGRYTLRVKASNSDGVWNEEGISLPITIVPPFWRTAWFTMLMVGGLASGTFGAFGIRARSFRRQKARLEAQVAQRTAEIERRQQVAEALRDLVDILNSDRGLDEMLNVIVAQAARLLNSDAAAIYRTDEQKQFLVVQAAWGLEGDLLESLRIPVVNGQTGLASLRQQTVTPERFATTLTDRSKQQRLEDQLGRYQVMMPVPLILKDESSDLLLLYYRSRRDLTEEEIGLATTFADQAALAIESARLRQQAEQGAVVAERSRIARDLHDAVTQTLFSASLIADVLPRLWERNPQEASRRLEELRQLNRGALAEMRTLLLELRPSAILDAELKELFRHLVDAFTGRARIPVDLRVEGQCSLPPDVKVAFYRIAQEMLNNVAKHAQASHARLELNASPEQVLLRISDDGQGFDPDKVTTEHLGLNIMRERAASIGASLEVASAAGEGTQITLLWKRGPEPC